MVPDSKDSKSGRARLFMNELLSALAAGDAVLDLGCGNGSFRYADFPRLTICALDSIRPDKFKTFPSHVEFLQSSAEKLPYGDSTFDLVIGNFVFEHFADFASAVQEADRVLKEGGWLYMSVPNSKSFEDNLYRAIFHGGGHLQRHTFESILYDVYFNTRLKLVSYAEWPAGFTFLEDREALRQFIFLVVESVRRTSGLDLRSRCNYIFLFRREKTLGFRQVPRICTYCGAGDGIDEEVWSTDSSWQCPACGRRNSWRRLRLEEKESLEAQVRDLWKRHPHTREFQPEVSSASEQMPIDSDDFEELRFVAHVSRRVRKSRFYPLARKLLGRIL